MNWIDLNNPEVRPCATAVSYGLIVCRKKVFIATFDVSSLGSSVRYVWSVWRYYYYPVYMGNRLIHRKSSYLLRVRQWFHSDTLALDGCCVSVVSSIRMAIVTKWRRILINYTLFWSLTLSAYNSNGSEVLFVHKRAKIGAYCPFMHVVWHLINFFKITWKSTWFILRMWIISIVNQQMIQEKIN